MGGEAEAALTRADEPGLIGRSRELDRIAAARREAARGGGSLTVVSGGPGLGKSRLLDAAAAQARAERMAVVTTRCWPDGGTPSLWPWQSIVRDLCGDEAAGLLAAVEAPAAGERRFASCTAVTERLVAATAEEPACLVIDDVHAADAESLSLLRFVVRASPRPRLAIVVSRRTGALPSEPQPPTTSLLDEIEAEAAPMVLQPFDLADAARFLRSLGVAGMEGIGLDDGLVRAVAQVCRGNAAELRRLALGATDLVDGLRSVVRTSVSGLAAEHRAVLQAASILGTTASVAEVAAVAGCDRAVVLSAISEAAATGLVAADEPRLDFGHERVRAAIECSMPAGVRLDAHARAVSVVTRALVPDRRPDAAGRVAGGAEPGVEPGVEPGQAARWAYHALAAAPRSPDDARAAIAACRSAGRAMTTDLALEDADGFLAAAVELHDHDAPTLGPPPAALLVEWAQAALRRGHLSVARQRFERAVDATERVDDPLCSAEAALGLSGQWLNEHRTPLERGHVLGLQRSALTRLADRDDPQAVALRVRLEVRLAAEAIYEGAEVGPVLAALDRARALGDNSVVAEALSLTHHVLLATAQADRLLSLADELISVAAGGDPGLGLMGLCWRAVDLFLLGDDRAGRAFEALRERSTALGHESMLHLVDVLDVMVLLRSGRLAEAEAAAHRAHHRGQRLGEVDAFNYLSIQLLVIRWLQDRHGELAEVVEAMVGSTSVPLGEFAFRASAAVTTARAGRLDRARVELDRLVDIGLARLAPSSSWLTGLTSVVELAVVLDDADAARQAYDLLTPYADRPVLPSLAVVCLGSVERWLGLAAQVWGDHGLACRHLERAVQANLALDNRPMVAMARAELAGALMGCSWPDSAERAAELLDLAIRAAQDMGMSRRAEAWRDLEPPDIVMSRPHQVPAPGPLEPRQGTVRRRGRGWLIALDDRRVGLPELVGMAHVAELLRNPGQRIPALALAGGPDAPDHGDHHAVLDDHARRAYGERLRDLTTDLEEAEDNADLGRADRLRVEIDALVEQLETATGLAGRSRSFAHPPEKARIAVRKAITRALDRVDAADPVVGRALRTVIVTGTTCSYEPSADPTTTWTAEPSL